MYIVKILFINFNAHFADIITFAEHFATNSFMIFYHFNAQRPLMYILVDAH